MNHSEFRNRNGLRARPGTTLVELLVVITVLAILMAMVWAGLQRASQTAREARTKATIAKIDHFLMLKLESFKTRRVPLNLAGLAPSAAAQIRLQAIRDLMRMEMPDQLTDIISAGSDSGPLALTSGTTTMYVPEPGIHQLYYSMCLTPSAYGAHRVAIGNSNGSFGEFLYLTVMTGNAEARKSFTANEIGVGVNGWPVFLDGWGRPIAWLRWPVACSYGPSAITGVPVPGISMIQSGGSATDHDPFDPEHADATAFQLIPLIVSAAGHRGTPLATSSISSQGDDFGVNMAPQGPTVAPFSGSYGTPGKLMGQMPIHNHYIQSR